jgi:hypothetical protein
MNKIITGSEFNAVNNDTILYKLVRISMIHHDFKFVKGLNIDTNEFNDTEYGPNGIHFCFCDHIGEWINLYIKALLWIVEVPDDARVVIFKDKIKSDKIILKNIVPFNDLMMMKVMNIPTLYTLILTCSYIEYYDICWVNEIISKNILETVKHTSDGLEYVPKKIMTNEIVLAAVNGNGYALKYVPPNMITEKIILDAVNNNGYALQFVPKNMITEEIILAAVNNDGRALYHVPPNMITKKNALAAVNNYGYALEFVPIEMMTDDIILIAVKNKGLSLAYVPKKI